VRQGHPVRPLEHEARAVRARAQGSRPRVTRPSRRARAEPVSDRTPTSVIVRPCHPLVRLRQRILWGVRDVEEVLVHQAKKGRLTTCPEIQMRRPPHRHAADGEWPGAVLLPARPALFRFGRSARHSPSVGNTLSFGWTRSMTPRSVSVRECYPRIAWGLASYLGLGGAARSSWTRWQS
jgi:hypothetical protein